MMLDREKINFWTRVGALALAVVFVGSFVFFSVGSNANYNIFGLLNSGGSGQDQQQDQTNGQEEQVARAEQDLQQNPQDPKSIRRLGGLYIQDGQTDKAIETLENGRKVASDDPVIALYLGQAYEKKAQGVTDETQRKEAYKQAGDAYATAAQLQENKPQPYLLAGAAYEQAGEQSKAIEYWNGYLKLDPQGQQADTVKEHISNLLKGGETTGGVGDNEQQ